MIQKKWLPIYMTFFIILISFVTLMCLPSGTAAKLTNDTGLIQQSNGYIILAAAGICFFSFIRGKTSRFLWAEATIIILVYALREMDFHRLYTAEHITKWKLYKGDFPIQDKIIGASIMLTFFATFFHVALSNLALAYNEWKAKKAWPVYIAVWGGLLFISQVLDKTFVDQYYWEPLLEESMELASGCLMFVIVLLFSTGSIKVEQ